MERARQHIVCEKFKIGLLPLIIKWCELCEHPLTGLILRTLGPFNVFILLNGWICLHGVLD